MEAWYSNTIGRHLANSIRLSLSHLGTTLLLTAVNALFLVLIEYAKALALLIGASGCIYLGMATGFLSEGGHCSQETA